MDLRFQSLSFSLCAVSARCTWCTRVGFCCCSHYLFASSLSSSSSSSCVCALASIDLFFFLLDFIHTIYRNTRLLNSDYCNMVVFVYGFGFFGFCCFGCSYVLLICFSCFHFFISFFVLLFLFPFSFHFPLSLRQCVYMYLCKGVSFFSTTLLLRNTR